LADGPESPPTRISCPDASRTPGTPDSHPRGCPTIHLSKSHLYLSAHRLWRFAAIQAKRRLRHLLPPPSPAQGRRNNTVRPPAVNGARRQNLCASGSGPKPQMDKESFGLHGRDMWGGSSTAAIPTEGLKGGPILWGAPAQSSAGHCANNVRRCERWGSLCCPRPRYRTNAVLPRLRRRMMARMGLAQTTAVSRTLANES
jgi:hypothetical protein